VSMKIVAAAMLLAASLTVVAPISATATAAPTVDQVVAILAELTDPNRPAATKTDVITPGFTTKDDPAPSPGEPLPMPLPPGSQNVPPGVEVYCPNLVWVRRCHQCVADPAHQCWDR
jgi:hypothetical protein